MTPEELDRERAKEAFVITPPDPLLSLSTLNVATAAARLAREGWTPTDPDLIEARKTIADQCANPGNREYYLSGAGDGYYGIRHTLLGIKRGRELERGGR